MFKDDVVKMCFFVVRANGYDGVAIIYSILEHSLVHGGYIGAEVSRAVSVK